VHQAVEQQFAVEGWQASETLAELFPGQMLQRLGPTGLEALLQRCSVVPPAGLVEAGALQRPVQLPRLADPGHPAVESGGQLLI